MDVLDELEKIHPEKSLPRLSARRVTSESETSGKAVMVIFLLQFT